METIVVTGGAGFIGSNFTLRALKKTKARIVVVDKLTYAGNLDNLKSVRKNRRFRFHRLDIADKRAIRKIFKRYRPTALVNFAAETHVDRSIDSPSPFINTNLNGTFVLLEAARAHLSKQNRKKRNRFRFIHVSTDEVYGSLGRKGLFKENTPFAPNSPYSASKAGADHLVRAYYETYRLPTIITNCSNNYGPYQFPEKLVPLNLLNAIEGKPLPIYGDGRNIRDWLFVEDHCDALLRVLKRGRPGEKYNVGGNSEKTNIEVVNLLCQTLEALYPLRKNRKIKNKKIRRYQDLKKFVPDRPGHDRRYAIDASKIRRQLKWKPSRTLKSGLRKTVQWYLDNLKWCRKIQKKNYQRQRLGLRTK